MEQGKDPLSKNCAHAVIADRIFDGGRWHEQAAILINGGRVHAMISAAEVSADAPQRRMPDGTFLAPGFIDLQVNGGGGVLLNDDPTPDVMRAIARAHRRFGTTSCLPTLITDQPPQIRAAIAAAREAAALPAPAAGAPEGGAASLPAVPPPNHGHMFDAAQIQGQVHAQSVQRVGQIADRNPSETATIIRQWLSEPA